MQRPGTVAPCCEILAGPVAGGGSGQRAVRSRTTSPSRAHPVTGP
jgi:hypothetical protein